MKTTLRFFAAGYLILLFFVLGTAFFFWPQLGLEQNVSEILLSPGAHHWLGTDSLGRDLLQRLIQGGQVSMTVAITCAFLTFIVGVLYGAISGWFEGLVDRVMMRFLDTMMSIPSFVTVSILCLGMQYLFKGDGFIKNFCSLSLAISLTHWMSLARVTRGLVMETKHFSFIEAAQVLGATPARIFLAHIFPNIRSRLLILAAIQIPVYIMYESFMSFIGLGIQPPWTSWGLLLQEGWRTLAAFPHLILFPSLILFLTVWSLNILLDVREARL